MATFTFDDLGRSGNTAASTIMSVAARADADTPTVESVVVANAASSSIKVSTITNNSLAVTAHHLINGKTEPLLLGTDVLVIGAGETVRLEGTNVTASAHTLQIAIRGILNTHRTGSQDGQMVFTGEIQ